MRVSTFSIIIPCYKVEKYIRACLDSVLAQTVNDPASPAYAPDCWEAICTDDGSPDGTGAILDEYAAKDLRIKVIHQSNGGLSAARNAALVQAKGEWFYYLDSDDVMAPWTLETYLKMMAAAPQADMLRAGMVQFKDGTEPSWTNPEFSCEVTDTSHTIYYKFLTGYFQQFAYRRTVAGGVPFVGMSWCEERPYFAKCIAKANCIVETQTPCYGFRVREGSITHRKMTLAEVNGFLDATRSMKDRYVQSGKLLDSSVRRDVYLKWTEAQCRFLFQHFSGGDRAMPFRYWVASLKELKQFGRSTIWFDFAVRIMRFFPFQWVAFVLFFIPNWLKWHGIHR